TPPFARGRRAAAMNVEEYGRMYAAEERQWWFAGMRAISLSLLATARAEGDADGWRILDAGCGTGSNLAHFRRFGRAVGVDLSDDALRFCRQRGVAAARGSVLALPFPGATFDAVTSFDVLYHRWVADDGAAVRELARVLKPGGLLLVRVPALKMLWGAHDEAVHSRHRYTRAELGRLLEGQGLEVVRLTYANTLLFPLLFARRALDRLLDRHGSDVAFLPAPLEWAFRGLLGIESHLVRRVALPVGASVYALARKPAAAGGHG
ncbi:MAG TPA: class I SAM-dependent methyltransferase, partial [Vicinamibacteria bacterium]|nr:class I SAM-dependent methyltransferase [Vicinamibacteria bacterium]